jgi:hypothetical protein
MGMLLTFTTADKLNAEYLSILGRGVLVIVITIITLQAANKGTKSEVSLSIAIKIGIFAFALLMIAAYRETYGNFIGADISADTATLHFAGGIYQPTVLERKLLAEVAVGFPGRGTPSTCYIKFITTSGKEYQSAPTAGTACKEQQTQILALMK